MSKTVTTKNREVERIVEALLFSSSEPLPLNKIKEIIETTYPVKLKELKILLVQLKDTYEKENRGFQLDEIAEGFLLRTVQDLFPYVELLHKDRRGEKLSKAAMEVLAIIAFKQPITRTQIESIRGVDSSGTIYSLQERGLIEVTGRLETPGRPSQYGLTKGFLKHFGLKNFEQLHLLFEKRS